MPKHSTAPLATTTLLHDALNNYLYWLRWWEMMVASGLTIGLRLSGISYRLQKNRLPDMQELWRMTEEKHTAAQQSLAALPMAAPGLSLWQQHQTYTTKSISAVEPFLPRKYRQCISFKRHPQTFPPPLTHKVRRQGRRKQPTLIKGFSNLAGSYKKYR